MGLISSVPLCDFEGASYLLFSPNVPALVYYVHLPVLVISLLLGFFVLFKGKNNLANQVFFATIFIFNIWVFADSIFWASNRSDVIMFMWAIFLLVEPLVHAGGLYLLYIMANDRDAPFVAKFAFGLLMLPLILLVPTSYSLPGFDLSSCLAVEGFMALYYTYFVEIVVIVWSIVFAIKKRRELSDGKTRREFTYMSWGTVLFLIIFTAGNIVGSFTTNWQIGQFGILGMIAFMGFMTYSIVRYGTFNIRLVGSVALIMGLLALLFALLFVQDIEVFRFVVLISLVLAGAFSFLLIRSVLHEVGQREEIERLAVDLRNANVQLRELDRMKSEFLSMATHQLRSPVGAIKGYASLILEGSFGKLNKKVRDAVEKILRSGSALAVVVDDFLNISRIEQGRMDYNFSEVNLHTLVSSIIDDIKSVIDKAGLKITLNSQEKENYNVRGDEGKLRQVISNILDNSVKYTPVGSITISLFAGEDSVTMSIKDTGLGISKNILPTLFTKFTRGGEASKHNIYGSGLGLYIAKQIVLAHNGDLWAESEGEGKGSTFHLEFKRV